MKIRPCEGSRFIFPEDGGPKYVPCVAQAVTFRKDFRFGDRSKGEKLIVPIRNYFCQDCADDADDHQAEAAAEAAGS